MTLLFFGDNFQSRNAKILTTRHLKAKIPYFSIIGESEKNKCVSKERELKTTRPKERAAEKKKKQTKN